MSSVNTMRGKMPLTSSDIKFRYTDPVIMKCNRDTESELVKYIFQFNIFIEEKNAIRTKVITYIMTDVFVNYLNPQY